MPIKEHIFSDFDLVLTNVECGDEKNLEFAPVDCTFYLRIKDAIAIAKHFNLISVCVIPRFPKFYGALFEDLRGLSNEEYLLKLAGVKYSEYCRPQWVRVPFSKNPTRAELDELITSTQYEF